jgi:hypothetical protein
MSDNESTQLVNAEGKPIKSTATVRVPIVMREKAAHNVLKYYLNSPEKQEFVIAMLPYGNAADNMTVQFSVSDPTFQAACLTYGAQNIINKALDEDLTEAYDLLLHLADLPQYKPDEALTEITSDDIDVIYNHYAMAPEMQNAVEMCRIQGDITRFLTGTSQKATTSYQVNLIEERFEDIADSLHFEQRAAGYYNISMMHRTILLENEHYDPDENSSEKECLKKVLEYTSDYKKINYCVNRLGDSFKDQSFIRAAYRRALTETDVPSDLYKINTALAQSYLKDYKPIAGFVTNANLHDKNTEKLQRAELYYKQSLQYAQKPEKINVLKNIAKLQLQQCKYDEWMQTKTDLALKYLKGEERVNTLLEIAGKSTDFKQDYLERALKETASSRKIIKPQKTLLLNKIAHHLRPIYKAQNNIDGINNLDKLTGNHNTTPPQKLNCPLQKYIKQR